MSSTPIRVTIWNENVHERKHEAVRKVYPNGVHRARPTVCMPDVCPNTKPLEIIRSVDAAHGKAGVLQQD